MRDWRFSVYNDPIDSQNRYWRVCFPATSRVSGKRNPLRISPRQFGFVVKQVIGDFGRFAFVEPTPFLDMLSRGDY